MRTSVASISKKLLSSFFAATLALGLLPVTAFAEDTSFSSESNIGMASEESDIEELATDVAPGEWDALSDSAPVLKDETILEPEHLHDHGSADEGAVAEGDAQIDGTSGDPSGSAEFAKDIISQEMLLDTVVAQAESTRSFFLAQTLESTKTIPVVSAKLPLDIEASSSGEVVSESPSTEADGTIDSPDGNSTEDPIGAGGDSKPVSPGSNNIAADSTVVGSFQYLGMTFAVEAGGESVALMALDYDRLPAEFFEAQTVVVPNHAFSDSGEGYIVSRIAERAFAHLSDDPVTASNEVGISGADEMVESDEERTAPVVVAIPASVVEMDGEAFAGSKTVQYVVVSADNPSYGAYDGCLYDAEFTNLLLIPEGRQGAVRIASTTEVIEPEVFSHCPSVQVISVDAGSAAFSSRNGLLYDFDGTELRKVPPGASSIVLTGTVATIAEDAFAGCDGLAEIEIQDDSVRARLERFASSLQNVTIEMLEDQDEGELQEHGSDANDYDATAGGGVDESILSEAELLCDAYWNVAAATDLLSEDRASYGATVSHSNFLKSAWTDYWRNDGAVPLTFSSTRTGYSRNNPSSASSTYVYFRGGMIVFSTSSWVTGSSGTVTFESCHAYCPESSTAQTPAAYTGSLKCACGATIPTVGSSGTVNGHALTSSCALAAGTVTVSWHTDNAASSVLTTDVKAGATCTAPTASECVYAGWTLEGWYRDSACTTGRVAPGGTTPAISVDVSYYAKWTRNVVIHHQDKATETVTTLTGKKNYGATSVNVTMPALPTRSGWTFLIWANKNDEVGTLSGILPEYAGQNINIAGYEYWCRWGMSVYIYDYLGGSGPITFDNVLNSPVSPYGNSAFSLPLSFSRDGYTFTGWTAAASGSGDRIDNGSGTFLENKLTTTSTVYGMWDIITYNITYNLNSGTAQGGNPSSYNVTTPSFTLTNPVRTGYDFVGWSGTGLSGTGNTSVTVVQGSTGDRAYTANWTPTNYAISYDLTRTKPDGSTVAASQMGTLPSGNPASFNVTTGSVIISQAPTNVKAGYTFKGWYCDDLGIGEEAAQLPLTLAIPSSRLQGITVKAAYELTDYTVSIDPDGGTLTNAAGWSQNLTTGIYSRTYTVETAGTIITLPAVSKNGYTFAGYAADPLISVVGSTYSFKFPDAIVNGTKSFTAKAVYAAQDYELPTYVQFKNGIPVAASDALGSYTALDDYPFSYTVEGTAVQNLSAQTKPGYRFVGWTADVDCLVDGSGNRVDHTVPTPDVWIKPGMIAGNAGAPEELVAHFDYAEYPLYVATGATDATLSADGWNEVTDQAAFAALGLSASATKLYRYERDYTLDDARSGVVIPVPERVGMKVSGWDDNLPDHASELNASVFKPSASITSGATTAGRVFTAQWEEAPYTVKFEDLTYVQGLYGLNATDNAAVMKTSELTLTNAKLTSGIGITGISVNSTYFATDAAFIGYAVDGIDLSAAGWEWDGKVSTLAAGATLAFDTANVRQYFDDRNVITVRLEFDLSDSMLTHYTVAIGLEGGSLNGGDAQLWGGLTRTFTFLSSQDVVLPVPVKAGAAISGWNALQANGPEAGQPLALVSDGKGGHSLPENLTCDVSCTVLWRAKTASVVFDYNAEKPEPGVGYIDVPGGSFKVTYGMGMNSGGSSIADYPVPTRPGYRFLGFFDAASPAGAKQYYTAKLASARSWNKDVADGDVVVLYALWTKVDSETEHVVVVDSDDDATGKIMAVSAKDGSTQTVFDVASYSGSYAWDNYDPASSAPSAGDPVRIDAATYEWAPGFDVMRLPQLFNYEKDGVAYKLLGFMVGAGTNSSTVLMSDLAAANAVQLKVQGSDMDLAVPVPSFVVNAASVTPLYTPGYPGYDTDDDDVIIDVPEPDPGDPDPLKPEVGDTIATIFNANGGRFEDGSILATTTTIYRSGVRPMLPNDPVLKGYEFIGWSLASEHKGDDCDCSTTLSIIDSKVPRVYYAHYRALTARVTLDASPGTPAITRVTATYGKELAVVTPPARSDEADGTTYAFKGYFDDRGVQYLAYDGTPVRVWDKTDEEVTLYARWVASNPTGEPTLPDPEPDPGQDPYPDDPFPGIPDPVYPVPTVPGDEATTRLFMPVADGIGTIRELFVGTYDGIMRYTHVDGANNDVPAAASNVEVTIYAYAPDAKDGANLTAKAALERMRSLFEANAPADKPYLQGFTVISTGCNVSIADLCEGRTVNFRCLGSDLQWIYDGAEVRPASAVFVRGAVEAVYSADPVAEPGIDPTPGDPDADPPVPATQIFNRFNAGVGRFGGLTSPVYEQTVASDYQGKLSLPSENPAYDTEGYKFDGWFLNGEKVDANTVVDWTEPQTIYAHYVQGRYTVTLNYDDGATQVEFEAYDGQPTADLAAEFARHTPTRTGYEFAGWYTVGGTDIDDDAASFAGKPYYVCDDAAPNIGWLVKTVTDDVVLYPYWISRDYTLTWFFDHGAFSYTQEQPIVWNLKYGQTVHDELPAPVNEYFAFCGWYTDSFSALMASSYSVSDVVGVGRYFTVAPGGGYVFEPAGDLDRTNISLYAGWNVAAGPVGYTVTLQAGDHGGALIDGESETVIQAAFDPTGAREPIDIYDYESHISGIRAGWAFAGWKELVDGELADEFFPKGSLVALGTGNRTFVAQYEVVAEGGYTVEFDLGEETSKLPGSNDFWLAAGVDNGTLKTAFDAATEAIPVPRLQPLGFTGYEFGGWQAYAEDEDGALQKLDGTTLTGEEGSVSGQSLVNVAAAAGTEHLRFVAQWTPKTYQVRYFVPTLDAEGQVDVLPMDVSTLSPDCYANVSYASSIVLPMPVYREEKSSGSLFKNWGAASESTHPSIAKLVAGYEITLKDLIGILGSASVVVDEADGVTYVDVYAKQVPAYSFTVPLTVNIAFDLDDPANTLLTSAARIETTSPQPVRIERIAVDRAAAAHAFMLGEEPNTVDGSDRVALLVRGFSGSEPSAEYLSIVLDESGDQAVYAPLAVHGFTAFDSTAPLGLDFSLRFAADTPSAASAYRNLLAIRDTAQSLSIAKLYYTVGLAR